MTDNRDNAPRNQISTEILSGMALADGGAQSLRTSFLPTSFVECMELAKIMAGGTFIPARMRGKPGDCLAVILQASQWGMNPFSVAQKVYFVNDSGIPGYEAQLVVAVLNSSGVLKGTLDVEWFGEGEQLKCIVKGQRKDDARVKSIEQELRTIKTRNSPLWVQSPRQQLGYHTQRQWGRLYAPEVMLGVYAADELVEDGANARPVEAQERIPAPTRASVASGARSRGKPVSAPEPEKTVVIENPADTTRHDPETGEVEETEEQAARRLDAEAAAAERGVDDNEQRDETIDDAVPHMGKAAEPAADAPQADAAAPAVDWESWLTKLDQDLAKVITPSDVVSFMASKKARLEGAPDGVQNRARGYANARTRELEKTADAKPASEKKPTAAQARAAAAAEANAVAATKPEPEADADLNPDGGDDDVSPATKKADEIIAELNRKEMLVDLRSAKAGFDSDIDALDDENAERVTRAYRALEDKLAPRRGAR